MERQTLQQQTPVYHVCQACGGDGCAACSDLCIVEGDLLPINGVIVVNSSSGICDFCGCYSDSIDELSSDATPSVVILICPSCYNDYAHGGCEPSEREE